MTTDKPTSVYNALSPGEFKMQESIISFSPKNGNTGCMVGIESLLKKQKTLKEIRCFITDHGKPETPFNICFYRFSSSHIPDKRIPLTTESFSSSSESGNVWVTIDLRNEEIKLLPGRYLISIEWLKKPNNEGLNAQTIGFKESKSQEPISWMNWTGKDTDWSKDTGPYEGNFMIESVYQ